MLWRVYNREEIMEENTASDTALTSLPSSDGRSLQPLLLPLYINCSCSLLFLGRLDASYRTGFSTVLLGCQFCGVDIFCRH